MSQPSHTMCDELKVILAEAGYRSSALDTAVVMAGALKALSEAYPELSDIAADWNELTSSESADLARSGCPTAQKALAKEA